MTGSRPRVEIRRSARRRRTVSAHRDGDTVVVMVPAGLSAAEEERWVTTMLARLDRREQRRPRSDDELMRRARELDVAYLGGLARPDTVRWVSNQRSRWGSCTPAHRAIRLSDRLTGMPDWVVDYVLVHELAHLLEPGHDERFWAWVARYPRAERARGYLLGWSAGAGSRSGDGQDDEQEDEQDDDVD